MLCAGGNFQQQLMADLPTDGVTLSPPFTTVGVDVFGPWPVVARKTRGCLAESKSKRWVILFTCLSSRAVYIEVVEEMSSSANFNYIQSTTYSTHGRSVGKESWFGQRHFRQYVSESSRPKTDSRCCYLLLCVGSV